MVRILFFASLRDVVGKSELELEIDSKTSVRSLFQILQEQFPILSKYERVLLVAVNQVYATLDSEVSPGDEIAFFPPVSGGLE